MTLKHLLVESDMARLARERGEASAKAAQTDLIDLPWGSDADTVRLEQARQASQSNAVSLEPGFVVSTLIKLGDFLAQK